jgi:hypothetical protein
MTDPMPRPTPPAVDRGSALIAAALVGAALIVSWGVSGSEQRYQIAGSGDAIVRLDTDSGEMLACNRQTCVKLEAATREKRFGPVGVVINDTPSKSALPAPAPTTNEAER